MRKRLKISGGSALAVSILLCLVAPRVKPETPPAEMHRQVRTPSTDPILPVAVTKVMLGKTVVQKGRFAKPPRTPEDPITMFVAGDDWIQNLTIYLLNRTNKTIVYGTVGFTFIETTAQSEKGLFRAGFQVSLGRLPDSYTVDLNGRPLNRRGPDTRHPPLLFRPGQTLSIHMSDYTEQLMAYVDTVRPLAALTEMEVQPGSFFFDDGMWWNGGYRVLENSTWRKLGRGFFPGDSDLYVPGKPGWVDQ